MGDFFANKREEEKRKWLTTEQYAAELDRQARCIQLYLPRYLWFS
jgi:hypothetical protein